MPLSLPCPRTTAEECKLMPACTAFVTKEMESVFSPSTSLECGLQLILGYLSEHVNCHYLNSSSTTYWLFDPKDNNSVNLTRR